jgi:hypothetical protein
MSKESDKEIRDKIIRGIDLAYKRLLAAKQKEDGELVISRDGKVIKVKARKLSN